TLREASASLLGAIQPHPAVFQRPLRLAALVYRQRSTARGPGLRPYSFNRSGSLAHICSSPSLARARRDRIFGPECFEPHPKILMRERRAACISFRRVPAHLLMSAFHPLQTLAASDTMVSCSCSCFWRLKAADRALPSLV